ncbi:rhomboid family protein [Sediminibacillus albus]|uniref:Rhomboid protease GluP n=1 Tax=Sediminibacillus albus TaxID=407036 RepID=A0A1G9CT54_9BACI|nr:rhomboid family intramembrane serine protease [Sediminibacillus albus]SDK54808.1 rhomboid protease GluP [Sediminibacillus albus]
MHLQEEYYFLRLSEDLVDNHGFELLHIEKDNQEIWMEKQIKDTSHVVRLYHQSFDWKNHLKKDIATVIYKVKNLRKLLLGRKVKIHNVYVSTHAPVDEWESIKKPLIVKDRKPIEMQVYYLDDIRIETEKSRLYEDLGIDHLPISIPSKEEEMEATTEEVRGRLREQLYIRNKEEAAVFHQGKPLVTYILLALNILMFLLLEQKGGSLNTNTLIEFGAKYNPAILEGEWWRIISSMFLHIGFLHLAMNMLALYYLGSAVERIYGNYRFTFIYLLAGISGGLSSFAFNIQISAGASGAIFGLFGALLFFGVLYKKLFFQTMGWSLLFILGVNIVLGLAVPQIDNGAHLGGLSGGFLASGIVSLPKKQKWGSQLAALLLYTSLICTLIIYGWNYSATNLLQLAQQSFQEENYQQTLAYTNEGLDKGKKYEAELLFYRSLAHLNLDHTQESISDLEKCVEIKPDFAEAHYNLALLYMNNGKGEKAKQHADKASRLQPDNENFSSLNQRLSKDG